MRFTETRLSGSFAIDLEVYSDDRGWFARTYDKQRFKEIGHDKEWVQLNHSFTSKPGALRGMHFQFAPYREIKLVRCVAGAVFDVIVDLRHGSPTFLQWEGVELSAANRKMLYIPEGFAHGFQVLQQNSELIYHHSEPYTPQAEAGLRYDDPRIGIQWPLPVSVISKRDDQHPFLTDKFNGL